MDKISPKCRSANMRRIRSCNTAPEMLVRRIVYSMGYRYRLHVKESPGRPDLVFKGRRKVIFVHGCFWHQHPGCPAAHHPRSNTSYWGPKLKRNQERDAKTQAVLKAAGWDVLIVWECETSRHKELQTRLRQFLEMRQHAIPRTDLGTIFTR